MFCLFVLPSGAEAQTSPEETNSAAKKLGLSEHPTWLALLHYEGRAACSAVLTDGFFLSPDGRSDPEAELTATIAAYFLSWGQNPDAQARCRYPARYYWLSQQLRLPGYTLREEKCRDLGNWALFDTVKSVSLLLVSGYLGNPASTFGHALLKFNTDPLDGQNGLFDLTLNYGAVVPEKERTLLYVARGLFGGYKAGFSDQYFYTQDLVYSRTEFRDMWEYRLALTDQERRLLLLHVRELLGNKFDYYFLEKNCAYRLGELADLVIDEELVRSRLFWYPPVKLFYRLAELDRSRRSSGRGNLIEEVRFIPSSQRVLYYQLNLLTPDEMKAFNAVVSGGPRELPGQLEKFAGERQILILDSLLAYQQYRLIADNARPGDERHKIKDQILLARLRLPARLRPSTGLRELASPAAGSPPMVFGAGIAAEAKDKTYLRLNWSPFKQEITGDNSLEGNELVLFDLAAGFMKAARKVFLERFDLLRVLNLKTLSVAAAGESRLSWQLRFGADRVKVDGEDRYPAVGSFGVGRAWRRRENIIYYALLDLSGHTLPPYARLRPQLGLKFDLGKLRTWIYSGLETTGYDGGSRGIWGGKTQYLLTSRTAVYCEVSGEKAAPASLGLNWYW